MDAAAGEAGLAQEATSAGHPADQGYVLHTVSRFDTLAGLAIRYGVQVDELKRVNRLTTDMQLYALGVLRIPVTGGTPGQEHAGDHPAAGPQVALGAAGSHAARMDPGERPSPRRPHSPPRGSASAGGALPADVVAAGREAAAASVQLVESIDPELLLGVRGLRSLGPATGNACVSVGGGAEADGTGPQGGNSAVALLLALQHHSGRRPSRLGLGMEPDFPLERLTSSSSSERLEEEAASLAAIGAPRRLGQDGHGAGTAPWGRPSRPGSADCRRESRNSVSSSGAWSTDLDRARGQHEGEGRPRRGQDWTWDRDGSWALGSSLRGEAEGQPWRLASASGRAQQSAESGSSSKAGSQDLRGDAFPSPLVGLTGEQLTMRRRAKPGEAPGEPSGGAAPRGTAAPGELEELAMEAQGDPWEGAAWSAAEEPPSIRMGVRPGPAPGSGLRRNTSGGSQLGGAWQGSVWGGQGSASFESLEGLKDPQPVALAARWGTQVLEDLVCHLRRGGGWLLEKSTAAGAGGGGVRAAEAGRGGGGGAPAHPHVEPTPERAATGRGARRDAGIDLPVLGRGAPGAIAPCASTGGIGRDTLLLASDAGLLGNDASYGPGAARGTIRRPSKAKAALD